MSFEFEALVKKNRKKEVVKIFPISITVFLLDICHFMIRLFMKLLVCGILVLWYFTVSGAES